MAKRVVKRRLKIKPLIILLTAIVIISTLFFNYQNIKIFYLSKTTNYEQETISIFLEKNILNNVKEQEYSKTLEEIINTEYYEEKHLNEYLLINYIDQENFLSNIEKLLTLGYKGEEINTIYKSLSTESIEILINNEYIKDITNIISLTFFKEDKLPRYIDYYQQNIDKLENNEENEAIETIITYVNVGLDKKFYTNVTKIEDENNLLVVVNKYNSLSSTFVPKDLQTIDSKYQWLGRSNQLTKEAAKAFESMCAAAQKENITILAGSGYRSYNYQKTLYNNYVAQDGFNAAETYSARPGYSEHQTGLAIDVTNKNGFIDKNDKEYKWLENNSYKYGFILRYPKDKDKITGYMYEEWHYRYVGKDTAEKVYNSKLTFDEYAARNLL